LINMKDTAGVEALVSYLTGRHIISPFPSSNKSHAQLPSLPSPTQLNIAPKQSPNLKGMLYKCRPPPPTRRPWSPTASAEPPQSASPLATKGANTTGTHSPLLAPPSHRQQQQQQQHLQLRLKYTHFQGVAALLRGARGSSESLQHLSADGSRSRSSSGVGVRSADQPHTTLASGKNHNRQGPWVDRDVWGGLLEVEQVTLPCLELQEGGQQEQQEHKQQQHQAGIGLPQQQNQQGQQRWQQAETGLHQQQGQQPRPSVLCGALEAGIASGRGDSSSSPDGVVQSFRPHHLISLSHTLSMDGFTHTQVEDSFKPAINYRPLSVRL